MDCDGMAIRRRLSIQVGDSRGSYRRVPLEIMEVDSACILKVRPRSFPNRSAGGCIRERKKAGLTADFGAWTNGDGVAITDVGGRSCLCLGSVSGTLNLRCPEMAGGRVTAAVQERWQSGRFKREMLLWKWCWNLWGWRQHPWVPGVHTEHAHCLSLAFLGPSHSWHLFTPTSSLQICQFSTSIYSSYCWWQRPLLCCLLTAPSPAWGQILFCLKLHNSWLGGSNGKKSVCNAGDPGFIPGSGRSLREGNSNPLQYSWLENPMRSLAGYSPWGRKELDMTERLKHVKSTEQEPQWWSLQPVIWVAAQPATSGHLLPPGPEPFMWFPPTPLLQLLLILKNLENRGECEKGKENQSPIFPEAVCKTSLSLMFSMSISNCDF